MPTSSEIKPAYLISGTDEAKIGAALARLRERAEREGGAAALETFEAKESGGPDADAFAAAIPAMSLTTSRRYLLADRVDRWGARQAQRVAEALTTLGPETTAVLVARGKAPAKLAGAVKAIGGEAIAYQAPRERDLPRSLVTEAKNLDFDLELAAARMLVERMGPRTVRLAHELDRLAVWAGPGGSVSIEDLESMIADTSEEATWALSDALVERRAPEAMVAAERLSTQGESVTGLIYAIASRLRHAHQAATELEAGKPPREVESSLDMHPYAAKMLVRRLRGSSPADLRGSVSVLADLEVWCRGGSDYDEPVALTLAVRRAAGAGAGGG
jgi:DNA polymerase III delta subunit